MLKEFQVIKAVCKKLESRGYCILQRLHPHQRGYDIVALKHRTSTSDLCLIIEAKGETSSDKNSSRYGIEFSPAQIRDHVAVALYKAATVLSDRQHVAEECSELIMSHNSTCRKTTSDLLAKRREIEIRCGIALPDNKGHRDKVKVIEPILKSLGIAIFWVH